VHLAQKDIDASEDLSVPSLCHHNVVERGIATPEACESDLDRHIAISVEKTKPQYLLQRIRAEAITTCRVVCARACNWDSRGCNSRGNLSVGALRCSGACDWTRRGLWAGAVHLGWRDGDGADVRQDEGMAGEAGAPERTR
jgi:hypothetical protein